MRLVYFHDRIGIMDKILFLSENSELSIGIREHLEKSFTVECLGFFLNEGRNFIRSQNPLMVVAYIKDLSYESHRVMYLLLNSEEVKFVLIGSHNECRDFLGLGNMIKWISTPVLPHKLLIEIEDISDEIAGRPRRFRTIDSMEESMDKEKHILVVDDDAVALRTVTNYLKDCYRVSVESLELLLLVF